MNKRECQPQVTVMNHKPNTTTVKEIAMSRHRSILRAALAAVLIYIYCSPTFAVDYSVFSGYSDSDYEDHGKYRMFGLMDSLEGMGLTRTRFVDASPWQFYENSFRSYSPFDPYWPYDAFRADYSTVTAFCGPAGTFKNTSTNQFYFLLRARDSFEGSTAITNDIVRLGESPGWFWNDSYSGYCRYFMALGSNTIAMGPAMSDNGYPTYSRPDLLDTTNPNDANPDKIWRSVMTNGLRMVMGHTDYAYTSVLDRGKWQRFKEYHDMGYSIAFSFASTALDAHPYNKPVVLTLGYNDTECSNIRYESELQTGRSSVALYTNVVPHIHCYWWGADRVRNVNGWYIWDGAGQTGTSNAGASETAALPRVAWAYESSDAGAAEDVTLEKYLKAFGAESSTMLFDPHQERATYKIADGRQLSIDRRTDCLLYRDAEVSALTGPSELSQDECIKRATSFLIGNKIVGPDEVVVDSVIKEGQVTITDQGAGNGSGSSRPHVARYTVVLKRNIGELPILTNDMDTIRVEIGQNGKIASLVSRYMYGRKVNQVESVAGALPNTEQAKTTLSTMGDIKSLRAGILPMSDGTYIPVYEVATVTFDDGQFPQPRVSYLRMDTLEPICGENSPADADPELESSVAAPATGN